MAHRMFPAKILDQCYRMFPKAAKRSSVWTNYVAVKQMVCYTVLQTSLMLMSFTPQYGKWVLIIHSPPTFILVSFTLFPLPSFTVTSLRVSPPYSFLTQWASIVDLQAAAHIQLLHREYNLKCTHTQIQCTPHTKTCNPQQQVKLQQHRGLSLECA